MMLNSQIHQDITILFSNRSDGSMVRTDDSGIRYVDIDRVGTFLLDNKVSAKSCLVKISYGPGKNYSTIKRASSSDRIDRLDADGVYTTDPGFTLFLPVADCIATVVYDPITKMIGLLHLGRHSSIAGLIEAFAIEVADNVGSDPRDWLVWMSPSIRKQNDLLKFFDQANSIEWKDFVKDEGDRIRIDMVGHNISRFIRAGVDPNKIYVSTVDTYSDPDFFSHRASTEQKNPAKSGRMIAAVSINKHP